MQDVKQQVQRREIRALKRNSSYFSVLSPGLKGEVSFRILIHPYCLLTYLMIIISGLGTVLSTLHTLTRIMAT